MAEYTPYFTQNCENPRGWTTVGRTLRGAERGTFVPLHHWNDRGLAEMHVDLLNRGISVAEARATIEALCSRAATEIQEE